MNASDRLDAAISQLEAHNDSYEQLLREYEDADSSYDRAYYKALLQSKQKSAEARKAEAKLTCADTGEEQRLRAARVRVQAAQEKARNIREILQGLRSRVADQRVGI